MHTCGGAYLQNLRECLDDARIFVTVYLDDVDESDLGLRSIAERLEDIREALVSNMVQ